MVVVEEEKGKEGRKWTSGATGRLGRKVISVHSGETRRLEEFQSKCVT